MRVLIIEQLSEKLLADHARLISGADVRIPLTVGSGVAAAAALKQGRWWVENLPLFEAEAGRHARWVHRLVQAQKHEGELADERSNGLIAYGLEVRLRHSVLAQAYVRQAAEDHGHAVGQINLDVLGDDPYLRDTFTRRHVVRQFRSVALHSTAATRSWVTRVRVRAAASPSIRKLVVARQALGSNTHSMTRSEDVPQTCRTAALFVQNQQSINLFRPVREELHSSGWRVRIFRYDEFEDRDGEAESFELAVQGAASCGRERLRMPAWTVADDCLDESPVSRAWLRVALNASWLTGWEQFVRHRRLLSAQRPNVVISYSVDAVALGLQAAAESLGIPSLFINHGSLGPTLSPWFFQWTALALAGRPCVDAHVVSALRRDAG